MEILHRDIVGGFIFSSDNEVVLGQSAEGGVFTSKWMIPGGGIEDGESELDALKREVAEETNVDIEDADISKIPQAVEAESEKTPKDGRTVLVKMIFHDYAVRLPRVAGEIALKDGDDFINARWFTNDEATELELASATENTLKKLGFLQ